MTSPLDGRPIIVALAGPNGAGKTTFYGAHLARAGLRFVNADELARELVIGPYEAAEAAKNIRDALVAQRESFVFETVFSDPVGDKLEFLRGATALGYTVVLCFIGLDSPELSDERVAMRVMQGGHDVPKEKLVSRYPRTLENLRRAVRELPHVLVFDNSDLERPFRKVATFEAGRPVELSYPLPTWVPWR
ncbi:MAG TPA: zeta toxin family protein [Anaeromyxobacteraceae bacterium]|nr:zeta toxin family protein [Anaeromyxobacteraceae bacterium]